MGRGCALFCWTLCLPTDTLEAWDRGLGAENAGSWLGRPSDGAWGARAGARGAAGAWMPGNTVGLGAATVGTLRSGLDSLLLTGSGG